MKLKATSTSPSLFCRGRSWNFPVWMSLIMVGLLVQEWQSQSQRPRRLTRKRAVVSLKQHSASHKYMDPTFVYTMTPQTDKQWMSYSLDLDEIPTSTTQDWPYPRRFKNELTRSVETRLWKYSGILRILIKDLAWRLKCNVEEKKMQRINQAMNVISLMIHSFDNPMVSIVQGIEE